MSNSLSDVLCLIFSKDRAVQLLALLESVSDLCKDFKFLRTVVLYRVTDEVHAGQYDSLKGMFPNVSFLPERNLEECVRSLLSESRQVLFLVDDCIVVQPFRMADVLCSLQAQEDCVGFSLRLGGNTNYCYPHSRHQKVPEFRSVGGDVLRFDWRSSEFDFGYPMELSSSVYRTEDILRMLIGVHFMSVNGLESLLHSRRSMFQESKPGLLCFYKSRAFCDPMNVVACVETNKNRRSGNKAYSAESLKHVFAMGMKMDVKALYGMIPAGCHQEVDVEWMKR